MSTTTNSVRLRDNTSAAINDYEIWLLQWSDYCAMLQRRAR